MDAQHWIDLLLTQLRQTSWIEWLAVALGVAQVLLARINNVWLYPTGIGSTLIYIFIMISAGLYAESVLNGYYLIMSIYGWVHWSRSRNEPELPVSFSTKSEWLTASGIATSAFIVLFMLLKYKLGSQVPFLDALVSAFAWAGMWLLARRKVENWLWLNVSNLIAIPLLLYKQLLPTTLLTIFLFSVACFGYAGWRKMALQSRLEKA